MTMRLAESLKKMTGCSYFVFSSNGTLLGGFREKTDAEQCMRKWQRNFDHDKLNKGTTTHIEEA